MKRTAVLFSGQGSQYVGMGAELCDGFPAARAVFECGSDILGFDLFSVVNGDEAELSKTSNSQPAIMAVSLAALAAAKERGLRFDAVAGHSLGEYAAMAAAGIVGMEDGFRLIKARAAAMQRAAESAPGSMCAIIGMDGAEIEKICGETDGYVIPVNYNSPVQTVIAGETAAVKAAAEKFSSVGARAVMLGVSAAFHSEMMRPAAEEFLSAARGFEFKAPECEFYSNISGDRLTDFSDMASRLAAHIISPVKFTSELAAMSASGVDTFIECGPGKVLTGLVKKTLKGANAANIENIKTLDKAAELF